MLAIKVKYVFGDTWDNDYIGCEHEFIYNGVEYLPVKMLIGTGYYINCDNIEELEIE